MINISIRFDDPSSISDHRLEENILDILSKHSIYAILAVVPFAGENELGPQTASHLIRANNSGVIEIAQHGYTHNRINEANAMPTEFAGADLPSQMKNIKYGRAILNKVFKKQITGFVPPFNTFDETTIHALEQQNFLYLSAGAEHCLPDISSISLLPRTCQLSELHNAIVEARRKANTNSYIIPVMHHYDFKEHGEQKADISLGDFDQLMRWISHQPDIKTHTLSTLATHEKPKKWHLASRRSHLSNRLHWRLRRFLHRYSLMTESVFRYLRLPEGR